MSQTETSEVLEPEDRRELGPAPEPDSADSGVSPGIGIDLGGPHLRATMCRSILLRCPSLPTTPSPDLPRSPEPTGTGVKLADCRSATAGPAALRVPPRRPAVPRRRVPARPGAAQPVAQPGQLPHLAQLGRGRERAQLRNRRSALDHGPHPSILAMVIRNSDRRRRGSPFLTQYLHKRASGPRPWWTCGGGAVDQPSPWGLNVLGLFLARSGTSG